MMAHLLASRGQKSRAQFRVKWLGARRVRKAEAVHRFRDGLQSRQSPEGVGELGMSASQPAITHSRRQQPITAIHAAVGPGFVTLGFEEFHRARHVRLHGAEVAPILAEFSLAHQGEHGDTGVFPHPLTAAREKASTRLLALPGGLQPLLRVGIVTQVARSLEEEVAVHHPQAAIHGGADLKRQLSGLHLASLLDVSRASYQKLTVPARKLKRDRSIERFPVLPVLSRLF